MALSGQLTPAEQLKVLGRIWGLSRKGYVFLPWINGDSEDRVARKKNYHEGRAFRWPADKALILQHLQDRAHDELYFSVNVFDGKKRVEQLVQPETVLYADLDEKDPRSIDGMRPTIAWGSSPDRFQGVWLLNEPLAGASKAGGFNHRLTAEVGADPSGWDGTQLLRVPGRPNFKPEYRDKNDGEPVMGEGLMWMNGPRYVWGDFDTLPHITSTESQATDLVDDKLLGTIDRHAVWARVRLKLPLRIREYMRMKDLPPGDIDRSDIIWDINCELATAGCSAAEIVALTRPTIWNKFSGRWDELKRLADGAIKAIRHVGPSEDPLEVEDKVEKPNITWLKDVAAQHIPRPRWLIKDIWTKGGLGFISGAPKSYKSWMALDMAVSISTGTSFLNQPGFSVARERPVLYLQEEDDLRLVMERLQLIIESKAPERFWHGQLSFTGEEPHGLVWSPPEKDIPLAMHVQTGFVASDPGWQAWLDEVCAEGKFAMVIIDTLGTTAGEIDTDKSGELMTQMLKPLRVVARQHDTAICIVHHNKKNANPQERAGLGMLGATALHAWVECAIYARSKDSNGEIAIEREAKLAMDMGFRVRIPMMHQDVKSLGERQLWDPEVITAGLETINEPTSEAPPQVTHAGTAGKSLAMKVKHMGRGPFSVEDIMERLGTGNVTSVLQQLEDGHENGYFNRTEDDRWSVVR